MFCKDELIMKSCYIHSFMYFLNDGKPTILIMWIKVEDIVVNKFREQNITRAHLSYFKNLYTQKQQIQLIIRDRL